jgi:hypothetical protein
VLDLLRGRLDRLSDQLDADPELVNRQLPELDSVRVKLPGHYERLDEIIECTLLEYALRFPGVEGETIKSLRGRGGLKQSNFLVVKQEDSPQQCNPSPLLW